MKKHCPPTSSMILKSFPTRQARAVTTEAPAGATSHQNAHDQISNAVNHPARSNHGSEVSELVMQIDFELVGLIPEADIIELPL